MVPFGNTLLSPFTILPAKSMEMLGLISVFMDGLESSQESILTKWPSAK